MLHMKSAPVHTTGEVAQIADVDRSTVHRWITAGVLPASVTSSGIRLITDDDLRRFLVDRTLTTHHKNKDKS